MSDFSNAFSEDNDFEIKQPIDLREILRKYTYHWPLFLLCLILSVGGMFLYLRYTPKIYNVKATLLIKDDNHNTSQLSQFAGPSNKQLIQNEIEILNSKIVMEQVVTDLDLNIIYKTKGWASYTTIYENKPFNIIFADKSKIGSANWEVKIIDDNNYQITTGNSNKVLQGRFGDKLLTSLGECKIVKTRNFLPYIGKTIIISFADSENEANTILNSLVLTPGNGAASTITLSLNDEIPQRAKDILNDLIIVYNDASITDKNKAI